MTPDDLSPPSSIADLIGGDARAAGAGSTPLTPLRTHQCRSCDDTGEVQRWSDIAAGRYDRLVPCPTCGGRAATADPSTRFFGLPHAYADLGAWSFSSFDCAAHDAAEYPDDAADDAAADDAAVRRNLEGALREARQWGAGGDGWLVLCGKSAGSGKTHLAGAALRARIETHGERGAFVDVPLLAEALRPNGAGDGHLLRERLRSVPALVLDSLGSEYQTAWSASELGLLLRERHRRGLATAVTCISLPTDPSVRSLLIDQQRSRVYRITAGDYRLLPAQRPAQP